MAETPRDKRDDIFTRKTLENNAIAKFTEDQVNRFQKISENLQTYSKDLEKLNNQFNSMSIDDPQYKAVQKEIEHTRNIVSGLTEQKNELASSLEKLGKQEVIQAQNILESSASIQQRVDDALAGVINTKAQIAKIESKAYKSNEDFKKLNTLYNQLEEDEAELGSAERAREAAPILEKRQNVKDVLEGIASVKGMPSWAGDVAKVFSGEFKSDVGSFADKISDKVHGPLGILINITGKIFDVAIAMRRSIDGWVDEAANVLAANVGRINAALEGTGRTYADATESMVESLGMNRFVKQTDYIEKIANLTAAGITYNVEQRAILETIKDKTIASFSSMEGSLLRLVRLKQTDITANQFGMEAALRNTLNRVFKDSTYMKDMFDGISGAITDAVMISGNKDVTEYSSVVQTWMGAMYESGIDSNMVTKMANAINALGSGNVSALASDQDMQRLILLSMDTIGMDYADILQQGLAPSDINDLLTAVVKYLSKIETNTKDNNVLQSSYTNLFGMSMADLQGFRNLKSKMGGLTSVNSGSAMAVTNAEVAALESTQRTIVAEQVNNALANARFTFGNEIAKNGDSYLEWKLSNMTLDVAEQYLRSPGKKNKIVKKLSQGAARIAQGLIFKNEMKGVLSMIEALPSLFNDEDTGISFLLNGSGSSYGGEDNDSNGSGIGATLTNAASGAFKAIGSLWTKISSHNVFQTAYQSYSSKDWEDDEDEQDEILSALESAMVVHNAEESKKAFATYLVGMTDDTLRSFASIFADEDAMADTFEGNNNVLKDNLFKYAEDTTSNSSDGNDGDADAGGADETE